MHDDVIDELVFATIVFVAILSLIQREISRFSE